MTTALLIGLSAVLFGVNVLLYASIKAQLDALENDIFYTDDTTEETNNG